jgi:hypothetical protein
MFRIFFSHLVPFPSLLYWGLKCLQPNIWTKKCTHLSIALTYSVELLSFLRSICSVILPLSLRLLLKGRFLCAVNTEEYMSTVLEILNALSSRKLLQYRIKQRLKQLSCYIPSQMNYSMAQWNCEQCHINWIPLHSLLCRARIII